MAFRFSERDVRDGAQEKLVAEPDFADGLPFARRSCTDPACGCLLVVAWVAAAALGMTAVSDGAPHRLEGALDYDGRVCGHSAGVAPRPLWYATTVGGGGVCVASCPSVNNFNDIDGGACRCRLPRAACRPPPPLTHPPPPYTQASRSTRAR